MTLDQTASLLRMIDDLSFQTGSVAFGLPNPSDHDRFCTRENYTRIVNAAKEAVCEPASNAEYSGTTHSAILKVGGIDIHIFVVKDDEMEVVKATTEMVTVAARFLPSAMTDKLFRVMLFRHIRDTLNMMRNKSNNSKQS
jgi:hypothetical protein